MLLINKVESLKPIIVAESILTTSGLSGLLLQEKNMHEKIAETNIKHVTVFILFYFNLIDELLLPARM